MTFRRLPSASSALRLAAILFLSATACLPAGAAETGDGKHHALSLVGTPKFAPDFQNFDWVNPDAPKGGTFRQAAVGGFDTLNSFNIKGNPAAGLGLIYDTLMMGSPDEPSTEYCLVCEWVSYPADFSSVTYKLREGAKFHDGQPITPEDVIFTLTALKAAHPQYNAYYKNVVKAEKTGEREVTFTFDAKGNRELPQITGQLPVLPKHYWEGKDAKGEPRDLNKSTLEVPLGSGPYKIGAFEPNRQMTFERVADYWAKDLPVSRGLNNFDKYVFVYYRDTLPAFEAFKVGDIDTWTESRASAWATQYNFDAIKKGLIKKEELPHQRVAPMQAYVFNLRRPQFQDARVRHAFNLAFNFEEANQKLFFGAYTRVGSFFDNSELKSSGLPQGKELEILSEVKDAVPPEVFTTEWKNPVNTEPSDFRNHLQEAMKLLEAAGWKVREEIIDDPNCGMGCKAMKLMGLGSDKKERVLTNDKGEALTVEILIDNPSFERVVIPYTADLQKLGIKASIRMVDDAQYEKRVKVFDYDVIIGTFSQSQSPGNEQRGYWGSANADREGSQNLIGIKNPAIDKLIDRVVFAKDREELVAATHALDRVLLWNHYVVPQWHFPKERLAVWDKLGRPEKLPSQDPTYFAAWWIDEAKAKALDAARGK